MSSEELEPLFVISVAAKILGMHAQTLRYYERIGVIRPSRTQGNIRLYSRTDIERLRHLQRLINDLGVNLAGAEIIINLTERMALLDQENTLLREEIQRLRALLGQQG